MQQKSWLEELFVRVLAVLEQEEFLDLSTVMQDGTKVRAVASKESFHRRKTLEEHRERAREALRQLEEQSPSEPDTEQLTRAEAARAAHEKGGAHAGRIGGVGAAGEGSERGGAHRKRAK